MLGSSAHDSSCSLRVALRVGASLLLLAGCPSDVTPVSETSGASTMGSTSSTSTGINPTSVADTLDSCGTGGCGTTTSGATEGSSSVGSSTGGTTVAGTTGTSSSDGGPLLDLGVVGTTSGTDTGVVFIVGLDVAAGMDCDPWLQDCPVGEKCNPWDSTGGGSWDANACFPVDPAAVGVGDTCLVQGTGVSGIDNCEAGAMCWDVEPMTNEGTCVALCTGSPMAPVCAAGSSCVIANSGVLTLCLPGCDPLVQDCAPGQACYPIGAAFSCAPDASGGMGADGDGCEFINVCAPGLMCADAASLEGCFGLGCCTPYCDVTLPGDPCPALTEECVPFFAMGMAPLGLEDVGVCAVP